MSENLSGKAAIITGGAQGVGAAIAQYFIEQGARVMIADVLDGPGQALATALGENARFQHLDVSKEAEWTTAVNAAVAQFGRLDVLVNNAGILKTGSIEAMSVEDYMQVIHVNQLGTWLGMRAALPAMKPTGGAIVNISSAAGILGIAYASAYVASKFAIRGMTKTAALEFGCHGIRVNSVHPGGIETNMVGTQFSDEKAKAGDAASQEKRPYETQPIARLAKPLEVAKMVAFLATDASSYCTGAEFTIDGGLLAGI